MKVQFPMIRTGGDWDVIYHRYYNRRLINEIDMHLPYVLNMLQYGGVEITLFDPEKGQNWKHIKDLKSRNKFEITVNDKSILFDLSDYHREAEPSVPFFDKFDAVFVAHWFDDLHSQSNNVFPLCPVNFNNWVLFEELRQQIKFNPDSNKLILHNQRSTKTSSFRRQKARDLICKHYPTQHDTGRHDQKTFFTNINKALVSIHVPGCRRDILDRAQVQMFGFGMCTISSLNDETFAWNRKLKAWVHYIPCEQMLDDLIDKIEWCKSNIKMCKEIGDNAKLLFDECIHPNRLVKWIEKCVSR